MKSTKKRALYIVAALLAALFVLSCLVGFAACGGSTEDDDKKDTPTEQTATVSSVSISPSSLSLKMGGTTTGSLTATVKMSDGTNSTTQTVNWTSSDTSVATVSATGYTVTVTALKAGTTSITASVGSVTSTACTVTVAAADEPTPEPTPEPEVTVQSVSVSPETLNLTVGGEAGALTAGVTMSESGASYSGDYTWKSSDETKVKVTGNGASASVEPVAATESAVAVTVTVDNDKSASCSVTVAAAAAEPEPTPEPEIEIDTEEALVEALAKGGEVALAGDIELTGALEISAETTLDLAGYTLSTGDDWTPVETATNGVVSDVMISVSDNASLTIEDSTGEGKIEYSYVDEQGTQAWSKDYSWNTAACHGAAIMVDGTGSSVTIESGEITSSSVGIRAKNGSVVINGGVVYSSAYYVIWEDVGTADVTINGGLVAGSWGGILVDGDSNYKGGFGTNAVTTLTINGGVVYSGGTNQGAIRTENYTSTDSAIITIAGGRIICADNGGNKMSDDGKTVVTKNEAAIFVGNGTLNILGGEITGPTAVEVQGGKTTISGGTLKASYSGTQNVTPVSSSDPFTYGYALAIYPRVMNARSDNTSFTSATDVSVSGGSFTGTVYVSATAYNAPSGAEWGLNAADSEGNTNYIVHISASLGMVQTPLTDESGEVVAYLYSKDIVSVPSDSFEFNGGTFRGFSGLDETFEGTDGKTYTAGDISITETVDTGTTYVVVDGIVANMMNSAEKAAFSSEISENDAQVRFYIAIQIAVRPGETVTVTSSNEKTETISNDTDEVQYSLWVIEVNSEGYDPDNPPTKDYAVVTMGITFSVEVTAADQATSSYVISFGNIFLPQAAWECAKDNHTVSHWTETKEATCGEDGSQVGICDICGETVTEVIPATGEHTWDNGTVTVEPGCETEGVLTKTCTVCGATTTEVIPATGHTATVYDDDNMYAVYKNLAGDEEEFDDDDAECGWCAYCETCEKWFEIEGDYSNYCIYDFVLVAKDEASLNAAITTAKDREDGSEEIRTQILVYGEIEISATSYVLIDCDNVEIYGLGAENSKIIDSAYEDKHSNTAQDGVEITGKNVTIRDLTIDGTALSDLESTIQYSHAVEILDGAANVTISNCVIAGGGTGNEDAPICIMEAAGDVTIVNCTLSGVANGLTVVENAAIVVTISGGSIEGARGIFASGCSNLEIVVNDATINGKNSINITNDYTVTFTNCTFGYYVEESGSLVDGSVNTYSNITFINCKFLSHTEGTVDVDAIYKNSLNYVIRPRQEDITLTFIDCKFENTHTDLEIATLAVSENTFIYLVSSSDVHDCYLYFGDPETSLEYIYDSNEHTVEHNHTWVVVSADGTKSTYKCDGCGAEKTELTVDHVVSATPSAAYVVATVDEENFEAPTFAVTMSEDAVYDSIDAYLAVYTADTVTWTSDNTVVATVDSTTGAVTILGTGSTTITVTFSFTNFTASYTLYVGETIMADDPLFGEWSGKDTVTIEEFSMSLTVDVVATVDEDGFTLGVSGSTTVMGFIPVSVNEIVWENAAWYKIGNDYYIIAEEANGEWEVIDIVYDSVTGQLSTSFEFPFTYGITVTVKVEDATLERVTDEGGVETPAEEEEP